MKHTFTLTLAILLLAATGWGETNEPIWQTNNPLITLPIGPYYGHTNAFVKITIEDRIKEYAASGEICKVFGHCYPDVWLSSDGSVIERRCKLCGKVEPNWRIK